MPSLQYTQVKGKRYWRIVESRRVNGKPRPVPICYLGTIENIIERFSTDRISENNKISIQSFEHGNIAALMSIAKELDIVAIIDKNVKSKQMPSVGTSLLLAALNRAIHPKSKRGWAQWAEETSISRFFPDLKLKKLTSQHFWKQMNKITEKALESIEEDLTRKVIELYDLKIDTLFYDTTNFYTFIDSGNERCKLPKRGRNKQKRYDLRQFSLAVLVSRDGHIPLCAQIYEGNKVDVTQFPTSLTEMRKRLQPIIGELNQVTLVYDRGNNSKANQVLVDKCQVGYVAGLSPHHHSHLTDIPLTEYKSIEGGIKAHRLQANIWGEKRTIVLFISEKLGNGQKKGLEQHLEKAIQALNNWKEQLKKPGSGPRSAEAATHQIKELLKPQHLKKILKVNYDFDKDGGNRLTFEVNQSAKKALENELFGKRLLMTNKHDWETHEIIKSYHGQSQVEETFRQCKSHEHFAIRPQYHWTDQKIRVHVFICLLSLILGRVIEHKVNQHGKKASLGNLMERLSRVRLALVISQSGKKKKAIWTIENSRKEDLEMLKILVPNEEPFVYTQDFVKKQS